jgi:colicin import membrane protein
MQAARFEGSLLTSLEELKRIEHQRVAEERAAVVSAEERRKQEAADAERRRVEAVEAKQREEREAQIAIERAKADAEREARMRVEAAEAAERERQMLALAEARQVQELELRRAEVEKTRPKWMIAVTALSLVAAAVFVFFMVRALGDSSEAEQARRIAEEKERIATLAAEEAKAELERLTVEIKAIDGRVNKALDRLAAATTKAETDRIAREIENERKAKREAERKLAEWKAKKALEERMGGIHITGDCKNNSICKKMP